MSAMSRRYAEIEDIKEGFLDDLFHNGMHADEVERVMTSPMLLEQEFQGYLDRAKYLGDIDWDQAAELAKNPDLVLERIGE